jgi:hypothetical protein
VHPQAIIEDFRRTAAAAAEPGPEQLDLFSDFNGLPEEFADRVDFFLPGTCDFLLFYAKDKACLKFRRPYAPKSVHTQIGGPFHALRHTFITRLARSGVVPAVAKSLARHSTITLTMDHYTHTLIEDERSAPARLPGLDSGSVHGARATGTDG